LRAVTKAASRTSWRREPLANPDHRLGCRLNFAEVELEAEADALRQMGSVNYERWRRFAKSELVSEMTNSPSTANPRMTTITADPPKHQYIEQERRQTLSLMFQCVTAQFPSILCLKREAHCLKFTAVVFPALRRGEEARLLMEPCRPGAPF
jgi:hypothetical protein